MKEKKIIKKFIISISAVVSAIIMCFALLGCSNDANVKMYIKGNAYLFDDIIIEGNIPEEYKDEVEAMVAEMKEEMVGITYKFNGDDTGVCTWGEGESSIDAFFYKQDGKKVYVAETKEALDDVDNEDNYVEIFEVDGSNLVQTGSEGGLIMKIVFKKK
ncbi:MAG: hypothetical protein K2K28_02575 [Clostridia bacterium]|nr:hypothetical protein [Clostridia bacterium]